MSPPPASTLPVERAAGIRLVVFDVDGVLTDGRITYTSAGDEIKSFHVQDGAALKLMMQHDIQVAIITGRRSPMVERRAAELGITHLYQGNENKVDAFQSVLAALNLNANEAAHVGDDLPDLALFERVGLAISVPNGHPTVRGAAHWVTESTGGNGVAREVAEALLRAQQRWPYASQPAPPN